MTLDPDVAQLLEAARAAGAPPFESLTPDEARATYTQMRANSDLPRTDSAASEDFEIDGPHGVIPVRLYRPKGAGDSRLPILIYFHGGGWLLGDLESHDGVCRHLAHGASCAVLSVDYRLAPENKFPKAVDDAFAAVSWVRDSADKLNVTPERIGVAGDSAGGNLAAAVCQIARDAGGPPIKYQLLLYPALDFAMDTESHSDFADGYFLTRNSMIWFRDHYLRSSEDKADFRASPLCAESLAGLPPACVVTAEYDPLRDEGEAYAHRLARDSNVPITLWRVPGQIHGFLPMGKVIKAAQPALDKIARILKIGLSEGEDT